MTGRRRFNDGKPEAKTCLSTPTVYHAAVVIFLEFFAFGLLTTPMILVLDETFPKHTFLMNGIIYGVKGFLSFLSAPVIGALSDSFGRKPFLLLTVSFTCLPIALMKISHWWYFTLTSLFGIFAVTFSVALAYVADITSEDERSWGYGLVSATFAASLVSSPAIGAYLGRVYSHELVVALASAIAFLDVCFILACVPESLPEKVRIGHICSITNLSGSGSKFSWEKADPFSALRQMTKDHLVLMVCITTFLSYLPEAGQYSCFFVYLRLVMGFSEENVALFIAVVGIMSCITQTIVLSHLNLVLGPKRAIIVGLVFQAIQLTLYGFASHPILLWIAGLVASMSSITYPALSSFISNHAPPDQQGVAQGLITGVRGLCGGLGPALFGLFFYMFQVDLNDQPASPSNSILSGNPSSANSKAVQELHEQLMPGPPFAFGAVLVLLAILVSLFIPDSAKSHSTLSNSYNDEQPSSGHGVFMKDTRHRRNSPNSQIINLDPTKHDVHDRKPIFINELHHAASKHEVLHSDVEGLWDRLVSSFSDFGSSSSLHNSRRPNRLFRQPTVRFTRAGIVGPLRRFLIGLSSSQNTSEGESRQPLSSSTLPSSSKLSISDNVEGNEFLFSNPLSRSEVVAAADLSNYRAHHLKRMLTHNLLEFRNDQHADHRTDNNGLNDDEQSLLNTDLMDKQQQLPMGNDLRVEKCATECSRNLISPTIM